MQRTRSLIYFIAAVLGAWFLALAVPNYGPPNFRYDGSDPDRYVWNFGFPFATAIYDKQSGWHPGPFSLVLIPMEAVCVMVIIAIACWLRARRTAHSAK